jgi:hypothetical protein
LLKAGQNILLNNRLWHLQQVEPAGGRTWQLKAMGASAATLGMTRSLTAVQYGDELFIELRPRQYARGHLQQDWRDTERGPAFNCQAATWLDLLAVHTRHPASGDLKNEFSWSYSRAAKYGQCPRAYYYHYYAAWEGWSQESPLPVQRVYLLKNLTDLSRWRGILVHDSIKFALARLKVGQPVAETDLMKQMHTRAQSDFENSASGRYQQQPRHLTGFQEHYYQTGLTQAAWQAVVAQAGQYLHTFLQSDLYADLCQQAAASFLNMEELQSFNLAGTKVWVQLDLARRVDSTIYVYDWKTGQVDLEEVRLQLGIYGLYVRQATSATSLRALVYLLAENRLLEFDLDENVLAKTQAEVEASIAQLRKALFNAPANLADIGRFSMITDLNICRGCQFRELCGR